MSESHEILLARWLSGELTKEEQAILESKYDLASLAETMKGQEAYVPEVADGVSLWEGLEDKRRGGTSTKKKGKGLYFALAAVLIGLLAYFLLSSGSIEKIQTDNKNLNPILFADGSEVIMGPYSHLAYDEDAYNLNRNITLYGQAFFKVEKGVPFIVNTEAGSVEVLGTQFDVWSIDSKYMQVACLEGSVSVKDKQGQSRNISGGEQVYIVKGIIQEVIPNIDLEEDWRQNYRKYHSVSLEVLLKDLKRFYGVNFKSSADVKNDQFTGVLPINNLDNCIRFIETSLSYESEQSDNQIMFKHAK